MKQYRGILLSLGLIAAAIFVFVSSASAQSEEDESGEQLKTPLVAPNTCDFYRWVNAQPEELRRSAPFVREFWDAYRVLGPDGDSFDREARLMGYKQSQEDLRRSAIHQFKAPMSGGGKALASAWNLVGPTGKTVETAGCTVAIAIDPVNTNNVYVGAAGGGVWKSADAGANWTSLTDNVIPDQNVCSIAIDPSNPSTIWVGSGSGGQSAFELDYTGYGIFKSKDGGQSWTNIRPAGMTQTVSKVLVHPTKSNIVLAGTYSDVKGIYRTTDEGATWARVYPKSTGASGAIFDIVAGETIGGLTTFYAAEGNGGGESGVYKSTDDGATWAKVSTGITNASSFNRTYLHCPKMNPNRVYCLSSNNSTGYLWSSTNSGTSWTARTDLPAAFCYSIQGQGYYDLGLTGSPTGDTLYIIGIGAYASFKGGNWNAWSAYGATDPNSVHVDHHAVAVDPKDPRIVYNGNDGGLYKSTTGGAPGSWSYSSNGMTTTRIYHLGLDKSNNNNIWYGAQDQGSWVMKSGAASRKNGGDGFQPVVNPQNSNSVFTTLPNAELFKSVDGGSSWKIADPTLSANGSPWNAPVKMVPGFPSIMYKGEANGIVRKSISGGDTGTWVSKSTGLGGQLTAVGVSAANKDIVWAANNSAVRVSVDGGTTWTNRSTGILANTVTTIVTHWSNANFALVADYYPTRGQVLKTLDMGATWINVSGSGANKLPAAGVTGVAIDSVSPMTKWYAATDNGVYYTTNAGDDWWIAGDGLGLVVCMDIQVTANKQAVRVATYGRGIWEATINNLFPISAVEGLTAIRNEAGTELRWHSAAGSKVTEYHIERSIAGEAFEEIGPVHAATAATGAPSYSFFDGTTTPGSYLFKVREIDADGSFSYSNVVALHYGAEGLILDQSFPNPIVKSISSATTKIRFELPARDEASLRIFDASGNVVRTLIPMTHLDGGEHTIEWDGRNDAGTQVASGAYIYALETASGQRIVNKLSVIE